MALVINHTMECECGKRATGQTLDFSQGPGGDVEVDLDMLGDMTLDCEHCGRTYFVPSITDYIEEVD